MADIASLIQATLAGKVVTAKAGQKTSMARKLAKLKRSIPSATEGYNERYCAFIDILGFADEAIKGLNSGPFTFGEVREILLLLHAPAGRETLDVPFSDFRSISISDAVALSSNLVGLGAIVFAAIELSHRLLCRGFLVRGAICKGRLYHSDDMVFGHALVEAYRLESQVAKVPRILVSDDVVADMPPSVPTWHHTKWYLKQDRDGLYFLNIFRGLEYSAERHPGELHENYQTMARAIQARYTQSLRNPRHFEKLQWFAQQWNAAFVNADAEVKANACIISPDSQFDLF